MEFLDMEKFTSILCLFVCLCRGVTYNMYLLIFNTFWIVPGRCITWEMGGSQFTMTLWMGLSQTTKNDNGRGAHSRFPGFVTIPCTGSWWTGTPPNLQDGGRCRIRPWRNTEYVPGRPFAIFIQVSNRGRFCQYISLPMKYTVSGSTLQYNVGLTLSFQKWNTSINN